MDQGTDDLVVVGCGAGGLATAVRCLEDAPGSRVTVLERTSRERRGGNTAWTGAFFRLEADGTPAADFADRMHELSGGRSDAAVVEALTELAAGTVDWLRAHRVDMVTGSTYFLTSKGPRLMPAGGGGAIVDRLAELVVELGGTIAYETTAVRLVTAADGTVTGVVATGPDGAEREYPAKTVVLACGGFEGSRELLAHHLGEHGADLPTITPGGRANRGEGITMALAAGAAEAGDYGRFHGEPVDPRSQAAEALVMVYPYGILVDSEANRFVDEGSDTPDNTFEHVAYRIWRDAHQFAYLVADQKLMRHDIARALLTDRGPETADTLEDLARRLDLDPARLRGTVDAYNAASTPGELDVTSADGVATSGLQPPKSNWARPVDEPPYVAWPVTCAITFTFGGVRTDASARVLDADGAPVPGLYAVGELAGLYYGKYPGATSVLRALTFGLVAGGEAADRSQTVATEGKQA